MRNHSVLCLQVFVVRFKLNWYNFDILSDTEPADMNSMLQNKVDIRLYKIFTHLSLWWQKDNCNRKFPIGWIPKKTKTDMRCKEMV